VNRRVLARTFWIGAAAILVAAALVALAALLRGDFSETDGRILLTLGALLYAGGTAIAGLALADRGPARRLGWTVAAAAPVGLALVLAAIWSFVWEQENEPWDKLAWSAILALLAGLLATTALLLARRPLLVRLAAAAGALASVAAALSIAGIWSEPESDSFVKAVGATWILAALAFFLVPVLQRFTAAGGTESEARVLARLDDVELVATHSREGTIDAKLEPGERLALRRTAT
jgi:hypothetical protein